MKRRADIERVITWPASASERLRVHPSLGEALHDSDNAAVEAWLQAFLSGSGGNTELAGALASREWCYLGPVAFPLARLARCCGPEAEMAYHDPPASWEGRIARMAADIRAGWRPPPLIAGTFGGWDRVLLDGNHRHAALLACGRAHYPVIFVSEGARERMAFAARGGIPARWRGRRMPAAA